MRCQVIKTIFAFIKDLYSTQPDCAGKKYHILDFLIEFLPLRSKKRNFQAHREGDHAASSILPEMSRNQAELAQGTILSDFSGINNRYGTVREHQD